VNADGNTENLESKNLEIGKAQYQLGKVAFERGDYRQSVQCLEKAVNLVNRNSRLGGEVQIWLVTAYDAAEQREEAIALCDQLTRHPDIDTRKQSSRLLYILRAPRLKTRPEWLTQIPDLATLETSERDPKGAYTPVKRSPRSKPIEPSLEPVDLSQVNTKDNQFVGVALVTIALLVSYLLWLS
jgi:tetratricopeptide (TPR) repeat protein